MLNDLSAIRTAEANLQTAITNQQVNGSASAGLQAASVASAVADANAARAAIEQARGQIAQYETQISKATIVSPVDGVVTNRNSQRRRISGFAHDLHRCSNSIRVYAEPQRVE